MADSELESKEVLIDLLSHLLWACLVCFASVILWSGVYFAKARRNFEDAKKVAKDIHRNSLALEKYLYVLPPASLHARQPSPFNSDWDHYQQAVFQYTESAKDFIDCILRKSGRTGPNISWSLDGLQKIIRLNWPVTKRQIRELYRDVKTAQSIVDDGLKVTTACGIFYMRNNLHSEMSRNHVLARLSNDSMIQPLEYEDATAFGPSVASYRKLLNQFKPLQDLLIESSIVVLRGGAESGKTELCHSFAWHHEDSYWGVFWFDAKDQNKFQLGDLIAQIVEIRRVQQEQASITSPSNNEMPWLLIIDDASVFNLLENLLPTSIMGHILITTGNIDSSIPPHIHCEKMVSLCCAKELLMSRMNICSPWNVAERTLASAIIDSEDLKDKVLPLTLSLVGATIHKTKWTAKEYMKKFKEVKENILSEYKSLLPQSIFTLERNTIFAFEVLINEIKKGHRLSAQDTPELFAKLAGLQEQRGGRPVTFDVLRREFELLHKRVSIWNRFLARWQTSHGSELEVCSEPAVCEPIASSEPAASSESKVVIDESAYFDIRMEMAVLELLGICLIENQKHGSGRTFSIPMKALRDWIKDRHCKGPRTFAQV
ncbi:hypothetical protein N7493_009241 [Penicillium malachiteum]|uniref:NB-ARC domain-containing protein n=1 Tax=Penicillium malachiteum TaxID=1324776 RepID=A0AAD6MTA0_9EURO|nr:hypothetical protein N7493_009241 [Penicillium malachiteum]